MGYEYRQAHEATVDATVDEVWNAIATGPGIDSWFMGHTEVSDGMVRLSFGGYTPQQRITASEPGHRFAYGEDPEPDGRFIAYDFLIEARGGGSTSLRLVANGFLPGDDWADEFDAMTKGGAMYFATLIEYLNHFAGRAGKQLTAFGPTVADWDAGWAALGRALGISKRPDVGDDVKLAIDGRPEIGVVFFANEHTVAVRTPDAFYRFVRGFAPGGGSPLLAMHSLFTDVDMDAAERSWAGWLADAVG
jgi:uncharacterized protein YndB with AHSA1/START domain